MGDQKHMAAETSGRFHVERERDGPTRSHRTNKQRRKQSSKRCYVPLILNLGTHTHLHRQTLVIQSNSLYIHAGSLGKPAGLMSDSESVNDVSEPEETLVC